MKVEEDLEAKADEAEPLHFDRKGNLVEKPPPDAPAIAWAKARARPAGQ